MLTAECSEATASRLTAAGRTAQGAALHLSDMDACMVAGWVRLGVRGW